MYNVTIGFSRPKNMIFPIYSWAIRLFERTKYSHVYLRWTTKQGINVVYEASGRTVKFVNGDVFDKRAETVNSFSIDINENQYEQLLRFCYQYSGTDYGVGQAIGIGIARIFGLKSNPISKGKDYQICSETVLYFLRGIVKLNVELKADMAGPRDIFNLLKFTYKTEGGNSWKIN